MACLGIGALGTHEVRELESNGFVVVTAFGGLQFHAQFVKLDGEEADGHVPVETFGIGPALHAVAAGQLFIHREEGIKFVIIDVAVLESTGIHHVMYAIEYFVPFALVLLYRHALGFRQGGTGSSHGLLAVYPR